MFFVLSSLPGCFFYKHVEELGVCLPLTDQETKPKINDLDSFPILYFRPQSIYSSYIYLFFASLHLVTPTWFCCWRLQIFSHQRTQNWFRPGPCVFHTQYRSKVFCNLRVYFSIFPAFSSCDWQDDRRARKWHDQGCNPFDNGVCETSILLDRFSRGQVSPSRGPV